MRQRTKQQICPHCEGNETARCPDCRGGGGIWESGGGISACERCGGDGTILCPECDGTGVVVAGE